MVVVQLFATSEYVVCVVLLFGGLPIMTFKSVIRASFGGTG
jgi:hypothetical protein